jgi:hypothetical protein
VEGSTDSELEPLVDQFPGYFCPLIDQQIAVGGVLHERSLPDEETIVAESPRVLWRLVGLSQTAIAV